MPTIKGTTSYRRMGQANRFDGKHLSRSRARESFGLGLMILDISLELCSIQDNRIDFCIFVFGLPSKS